MDILENFLQTEIYQTNTEKSCDMYKAIRYFITSCEIRRGEFEGHQFIINKLNTDTFIIYVESIMPTEVYYSKEARIICKNDLLTAIDKMAKNAIFLYQNILAYNHKNPLDMCFHITAFGGRFAPKKLSPINSSPYKHIILFLLSLSPFLPRFLNNSLKNY